MMETGSYLDYGMFLQSIMLAALDHDLATCTQASLADYPEIIKTRWDIHRKAFYFAEWHWDMKTKRH